jgi:predicted nucleic acid-binding protein
VVSLADTNLLVYCFDPREPAKREAARTLLRSSAAAKTICLPHQAIVEFVSVVTRRTRGGPLLPLDEAILQAEGFLDQFTILYPDDQVVRTALHGMAAYQFSWFDAHLWAYAERYGLGEILSGDFEHGRSYGRVRIRNPFLEAGLA